MSAWLLRAWFKFQFAIPLPKTSGNSSTHAYRLYIINDPLLASPRSAKLWIVARFLRKTLFKKLFYFSKLPSIRITHQPHATLSAYSDLFRSPTTISRASYCSTLSEVSWVFRKIFLFFKIPPKCVTNNQTATHNIISTPSPFGLGFATISEALNCSALSEEDYHPENIFIFPEII